MWAQLVAAGCPNLQHLDLSCCGNVTDADLAAVAAGCPNLQYLDLTASEQLTDAGLKAVGAGRPNLKHVSLRYMFGRNTPRDMRRARGGLRRMPKPYVPQPHWLPRVHERDGRRPRGVGRRMP